VKGYRINMDLSLEEGIKMVFLGCIAFIRDQIVNRNDVHVPVHETRRTTKRIRAALRMIRDEIGYSNYYRENTFYREMARRISALRDHHVLLNTISGLNEEHPAEFPDNEVKAIINSLGRAVEVDIEIFSSQSGGFERILEELDLAAGRVDQYCRLRDGFVSVRKGIRRIYGRGYKYLKILQQSYHEEQFHEYRKNTKYLLYQMELIRPVYPKMIKAYAGAIDLYEEMLGNTRDYERLEKYILAMPRGRGSSVHRLKLLEAIHLRRQAMLKSIFANANRIYAEKPGEFTRRIGQYWDTKLHS
jgi:CHAD domain-containing protein